MSNSSSDSDEDNRVRNVNNLLLKSYLNNDVGVDFGQAHKKRHGDLIFDASYEGANLGRVDQVDQHEYELFIRPDVGDPRYRMWFDFTVHNTKLNQCVVFNIVNLSEELGFFYEGFTPVVRSTSRPNWIRMRSSQVFYYRCSKHKLRHVLSLTFRFDNQEDFYQFALNYPYTSSKLELYIKKWQNASSYKAPATAHLFSPSPDCLDRASITEDESQAITESYEPPYSQASSASFSDHHFVSTRRLSQVTKSLDRSSAKVQGSFLDDHQLMTSSIGGVRCTKTKLYRSRISRNRKPRFNNDVLYFQTSLMARSHMGRPITRMTITDNHHHQPDESIFIHKDDPLEKNSNDLINKSPDSLRRLLTIAHQEKKIIIILCRLHPSESPASFVCHGLIDFLLDECHYDELTSVARKFFTFEIFPMIDPDSVATGNSRTSVLGKDLEQCWLNCSEVSHPSLYLIKQFLLASMSGRKKSSVDMIIDIHANFHNYGASICGRLHNDIVRMERHALFPKLFSSVAQDFYFEDCIFDNYSNNGLQKLIDQDAEHMEFYTLQVSHFGYYDKFSLGQDVCHYDQRSYMRLGKNLVYALVDLHRHTGHIPISDIPTKLQKKLDGYHENEMQAFKLSLVRSQKQ